jgi:hypothetical protein
MTSRFSSSTVSLRAAACMVAAVSLFTATAASGQEGHSLKRTFKAGDSDRYRTTINVDAQGGAVKLDIVVVTSEVVKEVKADGTTTVETKLESGTINFGGMEVPLPDNAGVGKTMTTVYDKAGKIIKEEGQTRRGISGLVAMTQPTFFPDHPVKAGEEVKFDTGAGKDPKPAATSKGVITVVGLEKKSDDVSVDTVKVKVVADTTMKSPEGDMTAHLDGTALVEPGSGKSLLSTGTITGMKLPQIGEANMKYRVTRMKADDKK